METHPHELSRDDRSALDEMYCLPWSSEIRIRSELWEKVYEVIGRLPEFSIEEDQDGALHHNMDKPIAVNVRFLSTNHDEPNFMFRGSVVMKDK